MIIKYIISQKKANIKIHIAHIIVTVSIPSCSPVLCITDNTKKGHLGKTNRFVIYSHFSVFFLFLTLVSSESWEAYRSREKRQ